MRIEILAEALQHHQAGDLARAEALYRDVLKSQPRQPDALHLLGVLTHQLGEKAAAADLIQQAISAKPDAPSYHNHLGNVLRELGEPAKARRAYKKALFYQPDFAEAHCNLATLAHEQGEGKNAIFHYEQALVLNPPFPEVPLVGLAHVLQFFVPSAYRANLESLLLKCFASPAVGHQKLALVTADLLRLKYPACLAGSPSQDEESALLEDPLLLALLAKTINFDPAFERLLTGLRARFFLAGEAPEKAFSFLAALAEQGSNNAYVFYATAEEEAGLAALKTEIESKIESATRLTPPLWQKLLLFALYAPLRTLRGAEKLRGADAPSHLRPIIRKTLEDRLEEEAIAHGIPTLTAIADATSRAVQNQYEENPYPRWLSVDRRPPSMPAARPPVLADADARNEILIAGCGTGQQAVLRALASPNAHITAVDLSRASLAYAIRMARQFSLRNIDFGQADVLNLGALKKKFPVIECGGVLHHLEDPVAGWTVLADLLRPGGVLFVGLYSEKARQPIVKARQWIAGLGLTPTAHAMRELRQRVLFHAAGDAAPDLGYFKACHDLFDLNGCRDLLFHVREHRFRLPEIGEILDRLGLRFTGFHLEDPEVRRAYAARFPDDPEMRNLHNWDRFEDEFPATFVNMYQFGCVKPATP
ncbi:MAG: tetratricopeptide repeat protein [Pseudomonadota bacterium]